MSETVPASVAEWVEKADVDYRSALALRRLRRSPVPEAVCFHAQQCAEKYLKALLLARALPSPRVHDLDVISLMLNENLPAVTKIATDCTLLTQYAVEVRYPGGSATTDEADEAVEAMRRVRQFARRALGLTR
ncbi:MAG: HEPN domain-containing protein [Chloroflexota bacterium]